MLFATTSTATAALAAARKNRKEKARSGSDAESKSARFAGPVKSGVDVVVTVDDIVCYTCRRVQ